MRVSTRIVSPADTKSGTITFRPVSVVTFLVAPVAVSPLTPISAVTTLRSTDAGSSMSIGSEFVEGEFDLEPFLQERGVFPDHSRRNGGLLVALGVHEVEQVAVGIQELRHVVVQADVLHAVAGLEGFFDDVPGAKIADPRADGGVAAAGLVVGIFEHLEQPAVEFEGHSLAKIVDINHGSLPFLGWDRARLYRKGRSDGRKMITLKTRLVRRYR